MSRAIVECVPNFSDGRSPGFLAELELAVEAVPGAFVLNRSADRDHNRSVLTFAAHLDAAADAALAVVRVATKHINLCEHVGVHPRIGATDVLPFIPLDGASQEDCVALAHGVGERMASEFGIPVFFYGAAALRAGRNRLPDLRRGGFEALQKLAASGRSIDADCGPAAPHPTAGASAVGVRPFLVAYNINLESDDMDLARAIARNIRESNGGLPAVRALGMWLAERELAQVSINLCDHGVTGIGQVFGRVQELALAAGVQILESELIGLAPRSALNAELAKSVKLTAFDAAKCLVEDQLDLRAKHSTLDPHFKE